ncbi:MAG: hypothetical protein AAF591_10910 [Verrucomicrobiota bacterium]
MKPNPPSHRPLAGLALAAFAALVTLWAWTPPAAHAASTIGLTSSPGFPPSLNDEFSSLLRLRGFAHIASGRNPAQQNEIYLGHTDLGVGGNRNQGDLVWQDASLHNWQIDYDGASTISVTVSNATGSTSLSYDYTPLWAGIDPNADSFSLQNIKIYSKDTDRNDPDSNIDVNQAVGNIELTNATTTLTFPFAAFDTANNADQTLRFTALDISNIVGFETGPWRLTGTWVPTSVSSSTNGSYETSTLEFAFGGSLSPVPEPSSALLLLAFSLLLAKRKRPA